MSNKWLIVGLASSIYDTDCIIIDNHLEISVLVSQLLVLKNPIPIYYFYWIYWYSVAEHLAR